MTRSNAAFAGVRPITPTLCPAKSAISRIFGAGFLLELLPAESGRRPQHSKVLAHDGDGLRVGRHLQIATTDRKVGLASTKQGECFDRSVGRDRRQPDSPAFAGEGLGHRLNHFVIVASRRSDRNPESYRPQHIIQCARGGAKNKESSGQDQQ